MKKLMIGVLVITLLFIVSCEEVAKYSGEVDLTVTESTENYVWENEIVLSIDAENDDHLDYVKFYLNDEEVYEDNLSPYEYTYSTLDWDYGAYELKVKAVYEDDSSTTENQTVQFIACPIYTSDLEYFDEITETSNTGELIGNVDNHDWIGSNGYTFGPAFPNPSTQFVTINYTIFEDGDVSIIIINNDFEIVDTIKAQVFTAAGDHSLQWAAAAGVSNIYRFIIHTEDGFHSYGDVIIE